MGRYAADLALIRNAALAGGEIALRFFRKDPEVWWKQGNSPVSEADFAVDAYLRETLLRERGDYGWLSEEMKAGEGRDADRLFVVDPIDGTRAFLRGEKTWCISIAVVENGRPVAGAIFAPACEEFFSVTADGPAEVNGKACLAGRSPMSNPITVAAPDSLRKRIDRLGEEFVSTKAVPSLAYRLALVASGRLDATFIRPYASDWDIAAADLLLERAGGILCDRDGERSLYTSAGKRHGLLIASARPVIDRVRDLAIRVSESGT